jgi:hypothetical protein
VKFNAIKGYEDEEAVPSLGYVTAARDDDAGSVASVDTEAEDHCFTVGTMVETEWGAKPIETLSIGDKVWTRQGLQPIIARHKTPARPVFQVTTASGSLVGTGNHPVWVRGKGWKRIDLLMNGEILTPRQRGQKPAEKRGLCKRQNPLRSLLAGSVADVTRHIVRGLQSFAIRIAGRRHCVKSVEPKGVETVYNITVAGCHEYYANGYLVHNCYDEARYMVLDEKPVFASSVKIRFAS